MLMARLRISSALTSHFNLIFNYVIGRGGGGRGRGRGREHRKCNTTLTLLFLSKYFLGGGRAEGERKERHKLLPTSFSRRESGDFK